ncbi:hypothetical protein B0H10DRAFT_1940352 [Mycena sp. CBHHK59/15]|nr:hypothetical protein B0H10DRAFT_1940352 [Mycena sp. CBHHK59/15]
MSSLKVFGNGLSLTEGIPYPEDDQQMISKYSGATKTTSNLAGFKVSCVLLIEQIACGSRTDEPAATGGSAQEPLGEYRPLWNQHLDYHCLTGMSQRSQVHGKQMSRRHMPEDKEGDGVPATEVNPGGMEDGAPGTEDDAWVTGDTTRGWVTAHGGWEMVHRGQETPHRGWETGDNALGTGDSTQRTGDFTPGTGDDTRGMGEEP